MRAKIESIARQAGIAVRFALWRARHRGMRLVFVSFADGKKFSTDRLAGEVARLGLFDRIDCLGPADLSPAFRNQHAAHFAQERGFGYWIWKPYVIQRALESVRQNDIVVYADAGCTVVADSRNTLRTLLMSLRATSHGRLFTANRYSLFRIGEWVKADVLELFGVRTSDRVLNLPMTEAGRLAFVKNDMNLNLVAEWSRLCSDIHLIGDSPSRVPDGEMFIEHRHDQSIFSLLVLDAEFLTGLEEVFSATRLKSQ